MNGRNVRTSDDVVHFHSILERFTCETAWENVPRKDRVWGKISVFPTDNPVTCLECLARNPNVLHLETP